MNVDFPKNVELVEGCEVANVENDICNSNREDNISFLKVIINEEKYEETKNLSKEDSENSQKIKENLNEKGENIKNKQNAEVEKKKVQEKNIYTEEKKCIHEIKSIINGQKKNNVKEKECIEEKKNLDFDEKKIGYEKEKIEHEKKENLSGENKKKNEHNNDILKFTSYEKISCNENFLKKKKRDKYKLLKEIFSERYIEEIKKKEKKKEKDNKKSCIKENENFFLSNMNNNFMNKNKKIKIFNSTNERNDNLKYKNDLNNIYIDNDFFNNYDKLEKNSDEKSILNNSLNTSKKKKFFLILCNGCLVVFLGVSNNICGRMRNRVLKNFDSLTASYNAIAYITIYFILCIIYSKSRYIRKKHWCYIYPCINNFFKSKNKDNETRGNLGNNFAVDIKSENAKKKKKILKFYYIHKKKIYEPLLEDTNNVNYNNSFNNSENLLSKENYNLYNSYNNNSSNDSSKRNQLFLNKDINEIFLNDNNHEKTFLKKSREYNTINEEISEEEIYSLNEQELKEIIGNYKFYKKKNNLNEIKNVFQKKRVQVAKENNNDNKYKEHKNLTTIKGKWADMGAYKYVIIIALLDIISNTLYFVSQLAIPLTILLLLNQLNFIFSIILSYIVLKRKYNIHHVISVIIVLTGFLFFYVPFIYKETIDTLKQNFVNYYMNSNFFINLNYIHDFNHFNNFHLCNEPVCIAPFGLTISILFCILSIFLTSFGGILREIFFSEYIKKQQIIKDTKKKECMRIDNSYSVSNFGSQTNYFNSMNNKNFSLMQNHGDKKISKKKLEKKKLTNGSFYNKRETIKNKCLLDKDIEINKEYNHSSNNIENIFFINKKVSQVKYSNKLNPKNNNKKTGKLSTDINDEFNYFDNDNFHKSHSLKYTNNTKDKETENNLPYKENIKRDMKCNNKDGKISVILLSFNISFIQIILLPLIIYFQLLFNKNKNTSYLLYIKDSLKCFSGYVIENNQSCKYAFAVYALYIIVNSLFNLSVSSFYSSYSSAECFLILKSSTPITLLVLYFFNFPFITDNDRYFSIYFVISIAIVFTGVSYFFYQTIVSEKKKKITIDNYHE
ncbi:conserved Plasmodium protein, unknown function [Plasmodium gallinaceum]|uniref:Transporter n=1 Tax=Plasmodium gallinaceum TaxID=5849 RepID=A0A1J1GV28_PLAGA|nr:conserved Plasmodium protein, unknown function [Plasmodium gallinaceum]CRG96375.1 conserved Plasmodium protein, unknown function [Plasmodium gallinaceum]